MIYLLRTNPPPIEYEGDYFFDFYKKQYGKTSLEDFPHLRELGSLRLSRIRTLLPRTGTSAPGVKALLLDIGCAYGPFLAAAAAAGFAPRGIDPAEDAVRYVRDTLGFPAFPGFFPDLPPEALPEEGSLDVVTLWYVIEHFPEPRRALGMIRRLLKTGGVLAFSTPSCRGISGRKSLGNFLEKSPPDHRTVWDPQRVRRILAEAGFSLKRIVSTGHHPERFPLAGPVQHKHRGLRRCVLGLSRLLSLGDTFEVYAVKNGGEETDER
jgi:2-polyprenyl-3-methyl-5-hydroxy-6-metoxy-1,4-benzoquinol methylase